jgi:hypothetical protein
MAEWANAVRDSGLDSTSKHVAHVLRTYMTADGLTGHDDRHPSPALVTIAAGMGLSARYKGNNAVKHAIDRLEAAGLLLVERRRGRRGFRYKAVIPDACAPLTGQGIPRHGAGFVGAESRTGPPVIPHETTRKSRTPVRANGLESVRESGRDSVAADGLGLAAATTPSREEIEQELDALRNLKGFSKFMPAEQRKERTARLDAQLAATAADPAEQTADEPAASPDDDIAWKS